VISGFCCEVDETCALLVITQCMEVIPGRRFGTTCRSHLQGSRNPRLLFRNGGNELSLYAA